MSVKIADVLIQARALIDEEFKWTKGSYTRDRDTKCPQYCAVGALMGALESICGENMLAWKFEDLDNAREALADHIPEGIFSGISIVSYNDYPGTTHSDILALFDKAIGAVQE